MRDETILKEISILGHLLGELEDCCSQMENIIVNTGNLDPMAHEHDEIFSKNIKIASSLLKEFNQKAIDVDRQIIDRELEIHSLAERRRRFEIEIENLRKKAEIIKTFENCKVNCDKRIALKILNDAYERQADEWIKDQDFHFLICFDSRHFGSDGKDPLQAHKDVIDEWGYSWWGKFVKERMGEGHYNMIDPFGESMRSDRESHVAENIQRKVQERIKEGNNVYLYLFDPNPPTTRLLIGNMVDIWFGKGEIPHGYQFDEPHPQCAHFPRYYFQQRQKICRTCTHVETSRCTLRFISNIWFKINKIKEIENQNFEFSSLMNAHTMAPINFAVPILYPLLVVRKSTFPHIFE